MNHDWTKEGCVDESETIWFCSYSTKKNTAVPLHNIVIKWGHQFHFSSPMSFRWTAAINLRISRPIWTVKIMTTERLNYELKQTSVFLFSSVPSHYPITSYLVLNCQNTLLKWSRSKAESWILTSRCLSKLVVLD